jgi:hypothetical protein
MKSCIAVLLLLLGSLAFGQTAGTWNLYPPQATINQVSIDPPINADGSSVWSSKATVPVQYDVLAGYGPVVFESLLSSYQPGGNPNVFPAFSYLDFAPSSSLTFSQITNLSAVYTFTNGTCHGGALRWSVSLSTGKNIHIYYGKYSSFADCSSITTDPTIDQSGLNMINANFDGLGGDLRYDTSQLVGGTFYDTYAHAITLAGAATVTDATLVLDAGWGGDQVVTLGFVTVNDNTFVPKSGGFTSVCPTAPATIQVSMVGSSALLTVDETLDNGTADTGTQFRIVDCKYQYNIAGKSLPKGQFKVNVIINGSVVPQTTDPIGTQFALK